jgi:serine/threonine protein kinase
MTPEQWAQVKVGFHAATELPPAKRADFVREHCNGDAEMLRELQLLLESHDEAEHFIENPALVSASEILSGSSNEPWSGRTIGHYRVQREIGRGGMGVVLLALRGDDQYKKSVAIKLLRRGMDTEDILRRFRNERQILASLEHPYIARLIDGGMTDDGLPYFVLEYIEGKPLDAYCDQHKLSTNQRLELFRKVCAAVQYAHQNLIVHRDLKPSNILVTSEGEPKLLDFGIAKLLNPELAADAIAPTATQLRLMTPDYASPEQIRGKSITTASDIYSLGVLLYRLLTGHAPYRLVDSSPQEIERLVCDTEPERPSTAIHRTEEITTADGVTRITPESVGQTRNEQPDSLRRRLRGDLDNIVLMAMRKEPERRYQSAAQLSDDIRRYMDSLPVGARKDTFSYRASKFIGRNRLGVAAAALIFLAILGGLTASIWQGRVAARERDQARQEQAKADQLNRFLQSILSAAAPEQKGKDAKVIEVLNDAAQRVDTEFSNQPELRAQALLTIGQTYAQLGLIDQAEKALREAMRLNSQLYGEMNEATVVSMVSLGATLMNKAVFAEAETLLARAIATERKLSPAGTEELALGLTVLGELYVRKGEYEKAKSCLRESEAMSDKIAGPNNKDSAFTLISLARAQEFSRDSAGAETSYRASLAIFRQLPQRYEGRTATVLLNLGRLLAAKGDYDQGISAMREGDSMFQRKEGDSFELFESKSYLCKAFFGKRDYENAIAEGRRAVEIARKLNLEEGTDFLPTLRYVGLSLIRAGKAKEAEPSLRECLDRALKNLPDALGVAFSKGALGECLLAQNRFAEAEPLVVQYYEGVKANKGEKHPYTVTALKVVVELYEKWKKPDMADTYRKIIGSLSSP